MHGAAVGEIVATRSRQHPDAQRKVGRHLVGSATKDVALINECCNSAGRGALVDSDHPGESRVHRKPQHLAAQGRNRLVVRIERVEIGQEFPSLSKCAGRRCVDEAKVVG